MMKMETAYSVEDAQIRFPELLERAVRGEEIHITQQGSPVACLGPFPVPHPSTQQERDDAFHLMQQIADRNTLGGPSIRQLIDAGRR